MCGDRDVYESECVCMNECVIDICVSVYVSVCDMCFNKYVCDIYVNACMCLDVLTFINFSYASFLPWSRGPSFSPPERSPC